MHRSVARLVGIATLLALSLVVVPNAGALDAGFDLFQTDPGATHFAFQDEFTIPAGFFDPGSEPFTGTVTFAGAPIGTFQGHDAGDADTVVQRGPVTLGPAFPATATVPIELVALSLVSVQPIRVRTGTATESWNVAVSLSPTTPSQGQLSITQSDAQGGTFSSQLFVVPQFQFTRVSDGTVRTLDVGQLIKSAAGQPPTTTTGQTPNQIQTDLTLISENVPWRAGCVPPALAVPAVNDGFCPGLTTAGVKVDNVEQSRLAAHGIVPAQPALEHFKCYAIKSNQTVKPRTVALVDQFGTSSAQVLSPLSLCAPVQKNEEPWRNRTAHLECFAIRVTPTFKPRPVAVRNQFGSDVLQLTAPLSLCAPTVKIVPKQGKPPSPLPKIPTLQPAALIDHFTCYSATSQAKPTLRLVALLDQFGHERVSVLQPVSLCAPVQKDGAPVQHAVSHLVCYQIADVPPVAFKPRTVIANNQFGSFVVSVVKPQTLCVPSAKIPIQ